MFSKGQLVTAFGVVAGTMATVGAIALHKGQSFAAATGYGFGAAAAGIAGGAIGALAGGALLNKITNDGTGNETSFIGWMVGGLVGGAVGYVAGAISMPVVTL